MDGGTPPGVMPLIPGTKFSQIAQAPAPPASTDVLMGVQAPNTAPVDYLYTVSQVASALSSLVHGIPASPTTSIQFNNSGSFGGNAGFTYDATNQAVTINEIANPAASALTIGGGTALTTSQPALNITQTWNNAAVAFDGAKLNITATAYHASDERTPTTDSKIIDLQVGGTTQFYVDAFGDIVLPTGSGFVSHTSVSFGYWRNGLTLASSNPAIPLDSGPIAWTATTDLSTTPDVWLARTPGTGTLGLWGGTGFNSPATLQIYNAFTNTTNYERATLDWNENTSPPIFTIGTEKGSGGGSTRGVNFIYGGATLMDLGVSSASTIGIQNKMYFPSSNNFIVFSNTGPTYFLDYGATQTVGVSSSAAIGRNTTVGGVPTWQWFFTAETGLLCFGGMTSGFPGLVNDDTTGSKLALFPADKSTNPTTLRIYNTFTNSTNFERATLDWNETSGVFTIGTEVGTAGGTVRPLVLGTSLAATSSVREALRVDTLQHVTINDIGYTSGNVSIAGANSTLQTISNGNLYWASSYIGVSDGGFGPAFLVCGTRGSSPTPSTLSHLNDSAGTFNFYLDNGGAYTLMAQIVAFADVAPVMSSFIHGALQFVVGDGTASANKIALTLTSAQSVVCGNAAIATNATDGFLYIPTCAGTPTGTPTTQTGRVPMVYDTTNNKFYIYNGGWKGGTNPGVFT